ncbi:TRAP transporter substrate-binding protein [Marinomonas aquiplantarum]|uniref:TRAP-type mannitol/chloroaromatic compound transport system substrate-binding protein n=1 Tax=Marinomonas aquiplantarum TaxID=491951 RepID=A0A366D9V7_9GAMM|nr:TRAP transporter substrate-binding protein [Marinomonas aquiplantarum]RBO86279.1 TRAP-type mannitol/chloroaromatic compound transport system substrate-binding protein [Marinomonas aquiplantarum]
MRKLMVMGKLAFAGLFALLLVACGGSEKAEDTAQAEQKAKTIHWKMVTTWPKNYPGLGTGAQALADNIKLMSNGRLDIKVYAAGELVPALEVFDAVSRGTAQMGHGASYYWKGKVPAAQFFTTVPFGLTAQEFNSWVAYGGGQELWDELYAPFNLIPMAAGNPGVQMGGWFNKEINSLADFQGLKMRMPGLGGEVLKKVGAMPVNLPGGEVFTALQTGTIDATEWVGPYNDLAFGLYKAAKYYYFPGWHEPGSAVEALFNKEAFEALPADLQAIVRTAVKQANLDMINEFTARNNAALQTLINEHNVVLKAYPADLLLALKKASYETIEEVAAQDPQSQKVYESFKTFLHSVSAWHDVSERAFINARAAE